MKKIVFVLAVFTAICFSISAYADVPAAKEVSIKCVKTAVIVSVGFYDTGFDIGIRGLQIDNLEKVTTKENTEGGDNSITIEGLSCATAEYSVPENIISTIEKIKLCPDGSAVRIMIFAKIGMKPDFKGCYVLEGKLCFSFAPPTESDQTNHRQALLDANIKEMTSTLQKLVKSNDEVAERLETVEKAVQVHGKVIADNTKKVNGLRDDLNPLTIKVPQKDGPCGASK